MSKKMNVLWYKSELHAFQYPFPKTAASVLHADLVILELLIVARHHHLRDEEKIQSE